MEQQRQPKAFISCSLRQEDKPFVDLVTEITKRFGFQPMGTIGIYNAAPKPIPAQMTEAIKSADCIILVATPRYIQEDIYNKEKTGKGISEMLHTEVGMAMMAGCPILAFVSEGTDIGSFLPNAVQYITLKMDNKDIANKWPLIANYFRSALAMIQGRWAQENKNDLLKFAVGTLGIIGAAKVLDSLFGEKEKEDNDFI